MKNINWVVRIKNKAFWVALIPAVLLLIQVVAAVFGYTIDLGDLGNKLLDVGDCTGWSDHVGIVVSCDGSTIRVIEGNKSITREEFNAGIKRLALSLITTCNLVLLCSGVTSTV